MNSLSLMNIIKKLINLLLSKAKKSLQWFLVLFSGLARICKLSTHQDQGRRVCDNDGTYKDLNILNIRHTLATSEVPSIPSEEQQIIPFSVAGPSSAHNFPSISIRTPLPYPRARPRLHCGSSPLSLAPSSVDEDGDSELTVMSPGRYSFRGASPKDHRF